MTVKTDVDRTKESARKVMVVVVDVVVATRQLARARELARLTSESVHGLMGGSLPLAA